MGFIACETMLVRTLGWKTPHFSQVALTWVLKSLGFLWMWHPRRVEERTLTVFKSLVISHEVCATREGEGDRVKDGGEREGENEDGNGNGYGNGNKDGEEIGKEVSEMKRIIVREREEQNSEDDKELVAKVEETGESQKGKWHSLKTICLVT